MTEKKRFRLGPAIVNINAMTLPLAESVVNIAAQALKDEMTEEAVAGAIKKRLAEKFPADIWQVFVGRNFGCFVSHEDGKFVYFYIGQTGFCVFAV